MVLGVMLDRALFGVFGGVVISCSIGACANSDPVESSSRASGHDARAPQVHASADAEASALDAGADGAVYTPDAEGIETCQSFCTLDAILFERPNCEAGDLVVGTRYIPRRALADGGERGTSAMAARNQDGGAIQVSEECMQGCVGGLEAYGRKCAPGLLAMFDCYAESVWECQVIQEGSSGWAPKDCEAQTVDAYACTP
jgi:hypothetical protein